VLWCAVFIYTQVNDQREVSGCRRRHCLMSRLQQVRPVIDSVLPTDVASQLWNTQVVDKRPPELSHCSPSDYHHLLTYLLICRRTGQTHANAESLNSQFTYRPTRRDSTRRSSRVGGMKWLSSLSNFDDTLLACIECIHRSGVRLSVLPSDCPFILTLMRRAYLN